MANACIGNGIIIERLNSRIAFSKLILSFDKVMKIVIIEVTLKLGSFI